MKLLHHLVASAVCVTILVATTTPVSAQAADVAYLRSGHDEDEPRPRGRDEGDDDSEILVNESDNDSELVLALGLEESDDSSEFASGWGGAFAVQESDVNTSDNPRHLATTTSTPKPTAPPKSSMASAISSKTPETPKSTYSTAPPTPSKSLETPKPTTAVPPATPKPTPTVTPKVTPTAASTKSK